MFAWWPFSNETAGNIVIGIVCAGVIYGISLWFWNNRQPVLTNEAQVLSKKIFDHEDIPASHTVVFLVTGDKRRQFDVPRQEYEKLAEGVSGALTFQGTRYKGFVRSS